MATWDAGSERDRADITWDMGDRYVRRAWTLDWIVDVVLATTWD